MSIEIHPSTHSLLAPLHTYTQAISGCRSARRKYLLQSGLKCPRERNGINCWAELGCNRACPPFFPYSGNEITRIKKSRGIYLLQFFPRGRDSKFLIASDSPLMFFSILRLFRCGRCRCLHDVHALKFEKNDTSIAAASFLSFDKREQSQCHN